MDYWENALASLPATHALPLDHPRRHLQAQARGTLRTALTHKHSEVLQRLAAQESSSLFEVLQTAFAVLLARWGAVTDVVMGASMTGRAIPVRVLRTEICVTDSMRAQLARNCNTIRAAFAHTNVPPEDLVARLDPGHEHDCPPPLQLMFECSPELAGVALLGPPDQPSADACMGLQPDLKVRVVEHAQGLAFNWDFDANLFEPESITSLARSYQVLLEKLEAFMDLQVTNLPLLDEHERAAMLRQEPQKAYPRDAGIAALFEEQARVHALRTAIVHGTRTLTYADLDRDANRIAQCLHDAGVRSGDRVGVCLPRGVGLAATLLGILKTGAAYVPLDADAPDSRLGHIVAETDMCVLVCERDASTRDGLRGPKHLFLEDVDHARDVGARLPTQPGGDRLAYIMYTSGSTGLPKGVAVTHRGVVRLVSNPDYVRLDPATVMAQLSNIAFDAATFELWGALCNGGCVVVLDQEQALDPQAFAEAAQRYQLNTAVLTSALFNRFAHEVPGCFAGFRDLLVGGEQVALDAVRRVLSAGPPERLRDAYGPTENTTLSTTCELTQAHVRNGVIPIGRSIAHSQCYVVDDNLELQPRGAVGELVVAGDGLALGYWNQPELTDARFVASPDSWGIQIRLYRTGDQVRYLSSGELQFLGRLDTQIKLRGFRIELGEIEEVLRKDPEIRDAVVVVPETDDAAARHLVAYCVPAQGHTINMARLRESLASALPKYMLPAACMQVSELPLNANGKLDRRALPTPDAAAYGRAVYAPPQRGLEARLAERWKDLLKCEQVGRHDDFMALGGNSLLLARLASELGAEFNIKLGFRAMYETRTLAGLAALVEHSCRQAGGVLPELVHAGGDAEQPLSFAQQSLCFIDRLNEGDSSYNLSYAYRLRGTLEIESLRGALQAIVMRHASLRTVFRTGNGQECAYTLPQVAFLVEEEPLLQENTQDLDAALQGLVVAEALKPFDLARDLMLRARVVRTLPNEWLLLLTVHHIAADGWSFALLQQEISTLYASLLRGQGDPLDPLPVEYADYARWQRMLLDDMRREQLVIYWRGQLQELPIVHQLPRCGASTETTRRAKLVRSRISAELVGRLQAFGLRHDATLFMTLQAAFALLLARWSGETDIVMGSPVANRDDPRLTKLIGYFVNSVVLRSDLGGNPTFTELLLRNRDMVLDAFEHQLLPFELLVEALNPERDPDSTALFQIMFVLQNNEVAELALPGITVEPMPRQASMARFDLTLNAIPTVRGLELEWEYRADRFAATTIAGLAESFGILLEALLAEPDRATSELSVLTPSMLQQLMTWSECAVDNVPDCCVHELFERRAHAQPEAIAIRFRDESLSFGELNRRAQQLAGFLRGVGVGPGEWVGLCLERTPAFVVSVLAVWKAGAAYVPLDPELPPARHEYIVKDAGIRRVLTQSMFESRFAEDDCDVLCMDQSDIESRIAASPVLVETGAFDPSSLAYAIYTSGSTGEPKGVMVEHRAVSRLLGAAQPLGYDASTVMLQSVNAAFDASILESWGPLCCGGQLVLYPGRGLEPADLSELIAEYSINTLTLPAALLDVWVEQLEAATGLTSIVVGGEALSSGTVARLYTLDDKVVVINHYGPTENGVLTSYYRVPRNFTPPVPIGLPVPGTQLFVASADGQLQPPGVVGELFVAGQGLARGYLNRPALTAEKFRVNEIAASSRWYRTGDLVRWEIPAVSGRAVLRFVGRGDKQVKIRGFRIELGEIEACLRACPGVHDAKVIVHQPEAGDRQLLAYVVAGGDARADWMARLQEKLPAYMVPAGCVRVDAWPLTRNGKVDVKALPAPDRSAYTHKAFALPDTETEQALLVIWHVLLKLDRISIDDSFFELGGHSLLVTRLQNRIRSDLDVEIPLRALFEAKTIRSQAARVDALRNHPAVVGALPRPQPTGADPNTRAPLSYSQQRLWFIHRMDSKAAQYHIPYRVRLEGVLDLGALRAALDDLVRRHAILRTAFTEVDGEPGQVSQACAGVKLVEHDLTELAKDQREVRVAELLREEALAPFDLEGGLPFRACLITASKSEHWLALTLHHIVADGWAMGVLERDLSALYNARHLEVPARLEPLALQYSDFACWQRKWLQGRILQPHLAYWREQLNGLPSRHSLVLDHTHPHVPSGRGEVHHQLLSARQIARLEALAQQQGATLFMVLHAAFALLLARFSGETDIVVGTPVANRRDESLASLVGLFINTLVLRSDLSGEPTFLELLEQSKRVALDAYEHQDVPFELLVEQLNPERDPTSSPLFQIMFILQNNETSGLQLMDLRCAQEQFVERLAKFDLTLNIQSHADGLLVEWEYNADLFDADTIDRMSAAYALLLAGVLDAPHGAVTDLPICDAAELSCMDLQGDDTDRNYPTPCLHELVELRCNAHPEAVAVAQVGQTLNFGEFNRRADGLAQHLRSMGVNLGTRVGVAMSQGAGRMVGLLAILKAGGVYVHMHPSTAEAALLEVMRDCQLTVLLVDTSMQAHLQGVLDAVDLPRLRVLLVDDGAARWANEASGELADGKVALDSTHGACVTYVSDSAGQIRYVLSEHRALVNQACWLQGTFALTSGDRCLSWLTEPGGGVVGEFWPLVAGATLVLPGADARVDPARLVELIRCEKVTVLYVDTATLSAFLAHPESATCTCLRYIFCDNNSSAYAFASDCRARLPNARLHLLYGSAVTAGAVASWEPPIASPVARAIIGRPAANTRIRVLDRRERLAACGVRGEIHVSGVQAARGYSDINPDVERTMAADPFKPDDDRMSWTGDMGRRLADGNIELLTSHPLHDTRPDIVPATGGTASTDVSAQDDAVQRALLAIWKELLNQQVIGVSDNFFALGGHSLLVLRMGNCLREKFAFELELKTFFADPTIQALAGEIRRQQQVALSEQRFRDCDASSETIEL